MNPPRDRLIGPLDEALARASIADLAALERTLDDVIGAAYWAFSRQARGTLADRRFYHRRAWTQEAKRRAKEHEQ